MMPTDRLVGGLYCHEVLERLSDHLDGELSPDARAAMEAHLADCDVCERFGGRFLSAIQALRRSLSPPEPLPEGLKRRLGL